VSTWSCRVWTEYSTCGASSRRSRTATARSTTSSTPSSTWRPTPIDRCTSSPTRSSTRPSDPVRLLERPRCADHPYLSPRPQDLDPLRTRHPSPRSRVGLRGGVLHPGGRRASAADRHDRDLARRNLLGRVRGGELSSC